MTVDIHCVTRWSKLDTSWEGVSVDSLLDAVDHDASYALAFCDGGYTTNLPLEDLTGGKAWIAFRYGGEPLDPEHGGPARLLVPHLYFWKSAKWVRGLRLLDDHEPGFWETNGYQAQRSYSVASAPGEPPAITVERLEDGEVSPYLVDVLEPGDRLEIRGPIGGHFVWDPSLDGALLLVGGGSGIVPLMAMLRLRARAGGGGPARLLLSSRTWEDVVYRDELAVLAAARDGLEVVHTLTREQPAGWAGYARRVDAALLGEVAWPASSGPRAFVCGPTSFVETVATGLVDLGYPPARVKTERFGPTGG